MPSRTIRNPARPDDDFKAQQKLEFDSKTATDGCIELLAPSVHDHQQILPLPSGPSCKTRGPGKAREPS
jgi:hypothetical protein